MDENQRKDLTNCEKECTIWLRLQELCKNKGYGTLEASICVNDGKITEIRYREFEGKIRGQRRESD
jgi:hypothetical protein